MTRTSTVIIGAGQCGLAMSHALTQRSIDHVVLERGQVANSWREERWDSLKLLSPNWMNGLAGATYAGDDPDGFMDIPAFLKRFEHRAAQIDAPVQTQTSVLSVRGSAGAYQVQTDQGAYRADTVVMANGACAIPKIPACAADMPSHIQSFTPISYKRPGQLPDGKVLVVGASASGLQLAREIQASGRQVILAVSSHLRFPRTYRGVDITRWLALTGAISVPHTDVDDLDRVRRTPSLTLVANETIDLNLLQSEGVEITGRLVAINDGRALFSGAVTNMCKAADLKMNRFLDTIDDWVDEIGPAPMLDPAERYEATRVPNDPRLSIDLARDGIGAVVWATGYTPDFHWLNLPVFDRKGRLAHDGGVVAPGLYALGLPYMRQRKSTFVYGANDDAIALADHLKTGLDQAKAA